MAFRTSEQLQRNELVRYQVNDVILIPANGEHQQKTGYKFTINDRSSIYDWYNGYFEVQFQLQVLADGTGVPNATRSTVINGAHSLINHIIIKSAGKIVYDTNYLHKVTFVKNLLEYSDDFSRSVAKDSFWYLDVANLDDMTAAGNTGFEARRNLTKRIGEGGGAENAAKDINVIIPLNRYGFFEELYDKMLKPMQLEFSIELQNDNELIYKAAAAAAGRVVVNRFLLWVPRLTPKDRLYDKFVESFLSKKSWTYNREMYQVSAPAQSSGFFRISSSIDNVKAIFFIFNELKQRMKMRIHTTLTLIN